MKFRYVVFIALITYAYAYALCLGENGDGTLFLFMFMSGISTIALYLGSSYVGNEDKDESQYELH